jgi:hypothetical protein
VLLPIFSYDEKRTFVAVQDLSDFAHGRLSAT